MTRVTMRNGKGNQHEKHDMKKDIETYLKYASGQHHVPQQAGREGEEQLEEEEEEQGWRCEEGKQRPPPLRRGCLWQSSPAPQSSPSLDSWHRGRGESR